MINPTAPARGHTGEPESMMNINNMNTLNDQAAGLVCTTAHLVRPEGSKRLFGGLWVKQGPALRNHRVLIAAELGKNPAALTTEELYKSQA